MSYLWNLTKSREFPIIPIIQSWEKYGRVISRKSFPIKLAYFIAIHKAQGLILPVVVIDIRVIAVIEFASG